MIKLNHPHLEDKYCEGTFYQYKIIVKRTVDNRNKTTNSIVVCINEIEENEWDDILKAIANIINQELKL
jgi:hypothetical protein